GHLFSPWWVLVPVILFWWLGGLLQRAETGDARFSRAVTYYERAVARMDHRWPGAGESGVRFLDQTLRHLYAADLDIFGPGSLFELLCQARTPIGQKVLADWLLNPAAPGVIQSRQRGVAELAPHLDLREDLAVLAESPRAGARAEALCAWGER